MNKYLTLLLIILLLFPVAACGGSGNSVNADNWEATDPEKWEAANTDKDWISPDIVFVGHWTTVLTEPLMPEDTLIHVDSTDKFLRAGWLKIRSESIHYKSKTATTFEGLMRPGDIVTPVRNGTVVAMLERGYYEVETTETYTIRYHAGTGESEQQDMLTVVTWPDETEAWMPIKKNLVSLSSVVLISSIAEDLRATDWNLETSEILVEGFKSDSSRVLTIRYQGTSTETWYNIEVAPVTHPFEDYGPPPTGFKSWITLGTPRTLLLQSGETKEIEVSLTIPKGAEVPSQRWMFWVWIGESPSGGMTHTTGTAVTWLINMGR